MDIPSPFLYIVYHTNCNGSGVMLFTQMFMYGVGYGMRCLLLLSLLFGT